MIISKWNSTENIYISFPDTGPITSSSLLLLFFFPFWRGGWKVEIEINISNKSRTIQRFTWLHLFTCCSQLLTYKWFMFLSKLNLPICTLVSNPFHLHKDIDQTAFFSSEMTIWYLNGCWASERMPKASYWDQTMSRPKKERPPGGNLRYITFFKSLLSITLVSL